MWNQFRAIRLASASLALACLAVVAPEARASVNVPSGSAIVVTLDQSVSSKDARVGQTRRGAGVEEPGHRVGLDGANVGATVAVPVSNAGNGIRAHAERGGPRT